MTPTVLHYWIQGILNDLMKNWPGPDMVSQCFLMAFNAWKSAHDMLLSGNYTVKQWKQRDQSECVVIGHKADSAENISNCQEQQPGFDFPRTGNVGFIGGKNQWNNSCQIRVNIVFCYHVIDNRLKSQCELSGLESSIPAFFTTDRQTIGSHTHSH